MNDLTTDNQAVRLVDGSAHAETKPKTQNPKLRTLPVLLCLLHLLALAYLARQHPVGAYATETDFYHFYAPDAERIAAGQFPQNTFQGPGYPAVLALVAKLTGMSGELFTVGKWLSVGCAVACGWLVFVLLSRLFGFWVGLGAQALSAVSGEWLTFSINATTDVFFLLLCLAVLVVFVGEQMSVRGRVLVGGLLTGATYVTRYNGLFLLVACLLAILLLNLFAQHWRRRLLLTALFLGAFVLAAAPWLYANYRHTGSPLYNTNYLNLATEFYPELVKGETNQDATRALEARFRSFGEVLRYDLPRVLRHYPVNLWESLKRSLGGELAHPLVAWLGVVGIILALCSSLRLVAGARQSAGGGTASVSDLEFGEESPNREAGRLRAPYRAVQLGLHQTAVEHRRAKFILFLLLAGALYFLLMGLNHWETRYYFFVLILYAGFAVYAVMCGYDWLRARFTTSGFPAIATVVTIALLFGLSLRASGREVKSFLATQPWEIRAARAYLDGIGASGAGKRIVARKPHLAYLSRNEWVFFPPVKSLAELQVWVAANRVDYLAISRRELKERKELKALGDPAKAPAWLKPVWYSEEPLFILYQPQRP